MTNKASVDTCNCQQFASLMATASAAGVNTDSLAAVNAWLRTNYNDTLSAVLWAGLQQCSKFTFDSLYNCSSGGEGGDARFRPLATIGETCDTLYQNIPLGAISEVPVFLSCGYVKPCITCTMLKNLTDSFRVLFPAYDSVPYISGTALVDTGKAQQNALWARYLNYKTGFSVTANDYITAYLHCNLDSGAANLILINRGTQPPLPVGVGSALLYAATATISFDSSYASNPQDEFETQIGANLSGTASAMCALNPPVTAYTPSDTTVDGCQSVEQQASFVAELLFREQQDSLIRNFDSAYRAKCLSVQWTESFFATYTPHEYHYTLYYYDQAGNLVKTLPPDAVQPNYDAGYFAAVAAARAAGTDMTNGANIESLATQYRYNTLNQVVAQRSPDGGLSHFWYDRLGRLAVSQNAKQAGDPSYSYTLYDPLGRITEVGQKAQTTAMTQTISQDTTGLKNWLSDLSNGWDEGADHADAV